MDSEEESETNIASADATTNYYCSCHRRKLLMLGRKRRRRRRREEEDVLEESSSQNVDNVHEGCFSPEGCSSIERRQRTFDKIINKSLLTTNLFFRCKYVFMWIVLLLNVVSVASCPKDVCSCGLWKGGKVTAECPNAGLTMIPVNIDTKTQIIDLNGNNFGRLRKDAFLDAHLTNLQRIFMSQSNISHVDKEAFHRLTNLVELDLSENALDKIPTESFTEIPNLRKLHLAGNNIRKLEERSFVNLSQLQMLDLSNCKIEYFADGAFSGLGSNLTTLKLEGNRLKTLPPGAMINLRQIHSLTLHGNPWTCDCHLRGFREFLTLHSTSLSLQPACVKPARLENMTWDRVSLDELACSPEIQLFTTDLRLDEMDNITVSCFAVGDPMPTVYWLWQGVPVSNISDNFFVQENSVSNETDDSSYSIHISNLTLNLVEPSLGGIFTCAAENAAGIVTANVSLTVLPKQAPAEMQGGGLTTSELSSIAIGLISFVGVVILVMCCVIVRVQQKRRSALRQKRSQTNHKLLNSMDEMSQTSPGEYMGPNPVQKPPRLGIYQGVPQADPDHKGSLEHGWFHHDGTQTEEDAHLYQFPSHLDPGFSSQPPLPPPVADKKRIYQGQQGGGRGRSNDLTEGCEDSERFRELKNNMRNQEKRRNILFYERDLHMPLLLPPVREDSLEQTSMDTLKEEPEDCGGSSSNNSNILFHYHSYPTLNPQNSLRWSKGSLISPPCFHKTIPPSPTPEEYAAIQQQETYAIRNEETEV